MAISVKFPVHIVRLLFICISLAVFYSCGHSEDKRNLTPAEALGASEKQLAGYPSATLQAVADTLYKTDEYKDKACSIYKILVMRHDGDDDDARVGVHANMQLWNRYMFEFRDLTLAMEYLNAAADIAETRGVKTAEVDYGYAISYQSMGNHTREADLYRKALGYYENAFSTIATTGETELYDRIISNYLILLYSMGEPMINSASHIEAYMRVPLDGSSDLSRKYNLELCRGLTELQSGRYMEAVRHFQEMRKRVLPDQHKQLYMAILNESTAYQQAGMTAEALEALSGADSISSTEDDEEMLASLYFTKCQLYKLLGDTANSQRYFILYCEVRDSLLSYNQITGLRKAEFSRSMTQQNHKLKELEYKGNVQLVIIIASAIIILTLIAFALIIRRKNKVLSQSNRALYEQNREVMAAEKREREERRRYASLVDELAPNQEKYSTRKLAEETKAEIYSAIMDVLENNDELYNSDFSLSRLSELCGSRQEYVSQVINETFDCNFNELVNKYRIREACRRIEDKAHYGQFTLAAIASGVGIDSATTFSKYFKKVTGMTPSQFKKNSDEAHLID